MKKPLFDASVYGFEYIDGYWKKNVGGIIYAIDDGIYYYRYLKHVGTDKEYVIFGGKPKEVEVYLKKLHRKIKLKQLGV